MTHTPGPWLARAFDQENTSEGRAYWIIGPASGLMSAADAHLIEAAPDLLAALKAVLAVWDEGTRGTTPFPEQQVRTALAKAEAA